MTQNFLAPFVPHKPHLNIDGRNSMENIEGNIYCRNFPEAFKAAKDLANEYRKAGRLKVSSHGVFSHKMEVKQ